MKYAIPVLFLAAAVILTGCGDVVVTINFPAAAIEKQAKEIVGEVVKGGVASAPDKDGLPFWVEDKKGDPDIGKTNKEIEEVKKRLTERRKELVKYMDKGNLGEKIDGYIDARTEDGLELKEKAEMRKLMGAENNDRKELYTLIAKANNVPNEVEKVARIYAKEWRANAAPNHYVQGDDGKWMKKSEYDKQQAEKNK